MDRFEGLSRAVALTGANPPVAEKAQLEREPDRVHARTMARRRAGGATGGPGVPRLGRKAGRNEPCPCGRGRKFEHGHGGTK
ncbi:MAG TPA: SEC-C metal-binding domain-containing protein [Acidimicrobiales bacterium]|nr:SEC-C metal-binding domain-containing protein [Acidimicrobiales bacterium]